MSLLSRLPRNPATSTTASHPVLVDRATGAVDIGAVRREVRALTRSPGWRWPAAIALADTFSKVRLQRRWALAKIAERAEDKARAAAAVAALDAEVAAALMKYGSTASLRHQLNRYRFGSLADTDGAARQRKVFRRALNIAVERAGAGEEVLQAAE